MAFSDVFTEIGYFIKRNVSYGAGKESAMLLGAAQGSVVGLGLAAGVSAGLTQMDYLHKKNNIRNFYKEEIAAKLHKPVDKVTAEDLNHLAGVDKNPGASINAVFNQEIKKAKRLRNFGIIFSMAASVAAIGAVIALAPGLDSLAGKILSEQAPKFAKWAVHFVLHAGAGVIAYNLIKAPIHWLGDKLFGLDKATTHDHIIAIHRDREEGKNITQEQVMGVFISANKELADFVVSKYGKNFNELTFPQKHTIAENIGKLIDLQQLTRNINEGHINVTELAFAVQGEASGVLPKAEKTPHKHGLISGIKHKLHHIVQHINAPDFDEAEKKVAKRNKADEKQSKAIQQEYRNEPPKLSFVERYGKTRISTELGHVQQLEQSRAEGQLAATRS